MTEGVLGERLLLVCDIPTTTLYPTGAGLSGSNIHGAKRFFVKLVPKHLCPLLQ